jgi:hypothetical protein
LALDLVFYEGEQFPREYKGSFAFVALKGSWNSSEPTGYKVVRVPSGLRIGKVEPSAHYFDFTFAGLFGAFRIYRVWIQVGVVR